MARARQAASPDDRIDAAIATGLVEARASLAVDANEPLKVAVAYSGGADSTALLRALARRCDDLVVEVWALHVHHGLQDAADAWLAHCRDQAAAFGVAFDSIRVEVPDEHASIEAEARRARYAALVRLCDAHGCRLLVTAHHADDQAETVLAHLVRGTGIAGLAAAARMRRIDDVLLLRPLLDLPSRVLRDAIELHGLGHIEDPSNSDRRYTRNAIRHEVMPPLRRIAPNVAAHLARTAQHAALLRRLLDEIGHEDLASDTTGDLDVDRLASLSPARASNALRVWLASRGMRAPSSAALREMLDQLLHAAPDAQIALLHERRTLRLYRGRISIDDGTRAHGGDVVVAWHGEPWVDVPAWNGRLVFAPMKPGGAGIDADALRRGPLSVRERRGGERLRPSLDGPSRTLKNLYQESGIAAWERRRLPLVYLDDRLVFAAGIGLDARAASPNLDDGTTRIALAWEAR